MLYTDLSCSTLMLATSGPSWPTRLPRRTWDGYWTVSTLVVWSRSFVLQPRWRACSVLPLSLRTGCFIGQRSLAWRSSRRQMRYVPPTPHTHTPSHVYTHSSHHPHTHPHRCMPMWYLWTTVMWRWWILVYCVSSPPVTQSSICRPSSVSSRPSNPPFRAHLMASGQLRQTTGSSNSQWANISWFRWGKKLKYVILIYLQCVQSL